MTLTRLYGPCAILGLHIGYEYGTRLQFVLHLVLKMLIASSFLTGMEAYGGVAAVAVRS